MQEKQKLVKSKRHANNLFGNLYSLYKTQELTDFCVVASNGTRFNAHKVVLAAGSEYFSALFRFEISTDESKSKNEVKIEDFNGEIIKQILLYLYTGTIELETKNLATILEAADFFEIKDLLIEIQDFIEDILEPINCLDIIHLARKHCLAEVLYEAIKCACLNFDQVSNEPDFLELDIDHVLKIICSDDLCVRSEEVVFLSLVKWIEHDKTQERKKHARKLISNIHYWSLSSKFIKANRTKLPNCPEVAELIFTWLEWHCNPVRTGLKVRNRTHSKLVFICEGEIHSYDPSSDTWTEKSLLELPPFDDIVEVNNKLIISADNKLSSYNTKTNELIDLPEFENPRAAFGLAVLRDELYVVGGLDQDEDWTDDVDKFDFITNTWQVVQSLSKGIAYPQAVGNGKYLYVKGNCTEEFIARFDPDSNAWTWIHFPFYNDFKIFDIAGLNETLYFVGQKSDIEPALSVVYVYSNGTWKRLDMTFALEKAKCLSWNNRLIVSGILDNEGLVFEHDPQLNTWKSLTAPDSYNGKTNEFLNVKYNFD